MALSLSKLESAYRAIFSYEYHQDNDPNSPLIFSELLKLATSANAANAWANAYRIYAEDASAAGGPIAIPSQLDTAEATLAVSLTSAFQKTAVPIGDIALDLATAMTVFWLTPPIVFTTGSVTAVLGTGPFATSMVGHWALNIPENNANAIAMAGIFDVFTKTVQVTVAGNPVFIT